MNAGAVLFLIIPARRDAVNRWMCQGEEPSHYFQPGLERSAELPR